MYEITHKLTIKDVEYTYDAMKSAIRVKGQYKSFMRVFGIKRTKAQAIELVLAWEEKHPLKYKNRVKQEL